jgi:tRNA(Ser,Leu) C12 N-acetylase TAN1
MLERCAHNTGNSGRVAFAELPPKTRKTKGNTMTTFDPTALPTSPAAAPSITRSEIVKMLAGAILPLLITGMIGLVTMYFNQQALAKDNAETRKTISEWQTAKEERTARLAVIETTLKALAEEQKEIRSDVKTLLQRVPRGSP